MPSREQPNAPLSSTATSLDTVFPIGEAGLVKTARPVQLIEPPRGWIISAAAWKRANDAKFRFDASLQHGQEYIGIRYVIPFGS